MKICSAGRGEKKGGGGRVGRSSFAWGRKKERRKN